MIDRNGLGLKLSGWCLYLCFLLWFVYELFIVLFVMCVMWEVDVLGGYFVGKGGCVVDLYCGVVVGFVCVGYVGFECEWFFDGYCVGVDGLWCIECDVFGLYGGVLGLYDD